MEQKQQKTGVFRTILTIFLTIFLFFSLLVSAGVYSVRTAFTKERLEERLLTLNWAEVELIYEGKSLTLRELYNREIGLFLGEMDEDSFNTMVRYFSLDTVAAECAESFRAWALEDGPVPVINPDRLAKIVVSHLDETFLRYLSFLGDPAELLAGVIRRAAGVEDNLVDFEEFLQPYEKLRFFLSEQLLAMTAGAAGICFLLLLVVRFLRLSETLFPAGGCLILAGGILASVHPVLERILPRLLASAGVPRKTFNILYTLLSVELSENGVLLLIVGLAAILFGALLRMLRLRRERQAQRFGMV